MSYENSPVPTWEGSSRLQVCQVRGAALQFFENQLVAKCVRG